MATSAAAIPPRRPRAGHVRAGYERLITLADEFSIVAREYRAAAGFLVLAEADIKHAREALDRGDESAARRALDAAESNMEKARIRKERVANLGDGLAGMLTHLRRWMARTGF